MIRHEPFITDCGATRRVRGHPEFKLPRFAVWKWDTVTRRPTVVEVGDDCEKLRAKYSIPAGRIVMIKRPRP